MMTNNTFKLTMPLAKSYEVTDADGVTHRYVRGLASGTNVDLQTDRVEPSVIDGFKKCIEEGIILPNGKLSAIPLLSGHRKEWDDVLGFITKAEVDEEYNLWIEAELDETSNGADELYRKLQKGVELGFSVGGKILQVSHEWSPELQKKVRVIEDAIVNEISVTSKPANPKTFVEVMMKSVDWEDVPPPVEEILRNQTKESVMTKVDESTQDAATTTDVVQVQAEEVQVEAVQQVEAVPAQVVEDGSREESQSETPDVEELSKTVAELQESVRTLTEAISQLTVVNAPSSEEVVVEKSTVTDPAPTETLEKAVTAEQVKEIMSALLNEFKEQNIDPLNKSLEEVASMPMDKSVALQDTKGGTQDTLTKRYEERINSLKESGQPYSPISEAVRLAFAANQ